MRKRISRKIKNRISKINKLRGEITELNKENMLFSDTKQWYTEEDVTVGRGKTKETFLAGKINWIDGFTDEDTGDVMYINRSEIVRKNGEWLT